MQCIEQTKTSKTTKIRKKCDIRRCVDGQYHFFLIFAVFDVAYESLHVATKMYIKCSFYTYVLYFTLVSQVAGLLKRTLTCMVVR